MWAVGDSLGQRRGRDTWLGADKGAHFTASAFLAAFSYYFARRERDWRNRPSQEFALSVSLLAGIAKEMWDWLGRRGQPSWKDLTADVAGIALGIALTQVPDGTILEGDR
ncbi:MAG: VanZ family protein [candidate division KSB1 bacterium]|nr:VanZ family protein [candidate division KSB1 bacterium]